MSDIKMIIAVDYSQVGKATNAVKELGNASVRASKGVIQATEKVNTAHNKSLGTLRKKLTFGKRMEAQQKRENLALGANTRELDKLRQSTDSLYAQQQKTLRLRQLLRREVNSGNMTTTKAAKVLKDYRKQLQMTNAVMSTGGKASKNMGMFVQQAGYQVGDFAVQLQGGQSALVAFSQQGSQLAGALPMLAGSLGISAGKLIALSTGLGVAIPLISAAAGVLFATSKDADEAANSVDDLDQRVKSITASIELFNRQKVAMDLGITVQQLDFLDKQGELITDYVDTVEAGQSKYSQIAEDWANSGNLILQGLSLGMIGATFDADVQGAADAVKEQEKQIIAQKKVIQEKQDKLFGEKSTQNHRSKITLATKLEFGEDSAVYNDTKNFNEMAAYRDKIDSQVELLEYTRKQGDELVRQELERRSILELNRQRNHLASEQLAILGYQAKRESDLHTSNLAYEEKMETARKTAAATQKRMDKVNEARVAASNAAANAALITQAQKIKLQGIELKNGKTSAAYTYQLGLNEEQNLRNKNKAAGVEDVITEQQIAQLQQARRINRAIEARDAIVDTTLQTYVDILGSAEGLQAATDEQNKRWDVGHQKLLAQKQVIEDMMNLSYGGFGELGEFAGVQDANDMSAFGPGDGMGDWKYDGSQSFSPDAPDKPDKSTSNPLADLQEQLRLEEALVGQSETRKRLINALGVDYTKYGADTIATTEKQIIAVQKLETAELERLAVLDAAKQKQEDLANHIEQSMENAFMSIADGTLTVKDAFKSMAADIIKELYRVLVVKQMVAAITGGSGISLFAENGAVLSGGSKVEAYANGGIVGGPTTFPMAGGKTGLMGEAGPEAIMPLQRGANGKLGVQANGGGGQSVVNNYYSDYNISANTSDDTKRLITQTIAQAEPNLTQKAVARVQDDRRRGGSMKASFG